MTDQFERDDQGVALRSLLASMEKMIDQAEGATPDERLANWLGFAIAAADLGPERSRSACDEALKAQDRIRTLLRRAGATRFM